MKNLLAQTPDAILHAGLHPTYDQIEMYAYHLPHATLANLIDIFTSLSVLDDSLYTLCHMDDFKYLADMVEHIKLPLKVSFSHTVWKLQDFSITQILREINFKDS